jgi:hypothetical protein
MFCEILAKYIASATTRTKELLGMNVPQPSHWDGWFIDMSVAIMIAGILILANIVKNLFQREFKILNETLEHMRVDIEKFTEIFQAKYEEHERRITKMEIMCEANNERGIHKKLKPIDILGDV